MEVSIKQMIIGNIALKYFTLCGGAYLIYWVWLKKKNMHRFIQTKFPKLSKIHMEIRYSIIAMLVTMTLGISAYFLIGTGITSIYTDISDYDIWYYLASYLIVLFIHDTYFYWSHRFMHLPKIYKYVHRVHHKSTNPSPWASFSFHPWEAIINNSFFFIVIFLIPVHSSVLIVFSFISMLINIKGHLGFELFPKGFMKNKWLNWNTTATHHNMHHESFNHNFGFYFTFWDKIMGTEAPNYEEKFNEVVNRPKEVEHEHGKVLNDLSPQL
ncbi:MAG: sterol desaturase family protein [Flavobacteriales bacterium]|nr:sterol desaturase family protein [Flavobacteriales bacterium]